MLLIDAVFIQNGLQDLRILPVFIFPADYSPRSDCKQLSDTGIMQKRENEDGIQSNGASNFGSGTLKLGCTVINAIIFQCTLVGKKILSVYMIN